MCVLCKCVSYGLYVYIVGESGATLNKIGKTVLALKYLLIHENKLNYLNTIL